MPKLCASVFHKVCQKYIAVTKVLGAAWTEDAAHLHSTASAGIFSSSNGEPTVHCPEPAESWKLKGVFGPNNWSLKFHRATEWLNEYDLIPILSHRKGYLPPGQVAPSLARFCYQVLFLPKNSSHRQSLEKTTAHLL